MKGLEKNYGNMKNQRKNTALRKKGHIKSLKKPNGHMKTREKVGHMKNLENNILIQQ